ncbi:MAG TPA: SH3 domain-containing protein [Cytophagales bacterium]|nr:SH3 domain-containing protein [Cytophagales bacterium]
MKKLLLLILCMLSLSIWAGNSLFYVIAKSGLNLRTEANTTAKVLATVGYGDEVTLITPFVSEIKIDGMNGHWCKVMYKNMTGYLVNLYLIPNKVPVGSTESINDYFAQVSTVAFKTPVFTNTLGEVTEDEGQTTLQKTLYKNGMEVHEAGYYEGSGASYYFPNWSTENVFLLLKQINGFKVLNEFSIAFPTVNKVYKKGDKTVDVKIKDDKINISYEEGAFYEIEIYYKDSQIVVEYSSGV